MLKKQLSQITQITQIKSLIRRANCSRNKVLGSIILLLMLVLSNQSISSQNPGSKVISTANETTKGKPMTENMASSDDSTQTKASQFLPSCPSTPNCVSSLATESKQYIEPLVFSLDTVAEMKKVLKKVFLDRPRTHLVKEDDFSIHFLVRSKIFRFGDDVHLYFDGEKKLVYWRSASRVGRSDFGVNRKRLEEIRVQVKEETL